MNEVKLSTKIEADNISKLAISIDTKGLGFNWKAGDIVRVVTNKKENKLTLKRVGKVVRKTISYTLVEGGEGLGENQLSLCVTHRARRFKNKFSPMEVTSAACRVSNYKNQHLEVHMPSEAYA